MGWLDKLKVKLGVLDEADAAALQEADAPLASRSKAARDRGERPPIDGLEPTSQQSLEDVLAARERGHVEEARRLLRELDRGKGLRLVLRAAAALEAGDEVELLSLLPKVRAEAPAWRLALQLASVLDDPTLAEAFRERAEAADAPKWALAWSRSLSKDADLQRQGLVELLVVDAALARTVAARDLKLEGAESDGDASERYAGFAHGRQCIRRFGATSVADVVVRAESAT